MTRNKLLVFKLGVASLSLFAAALVYSFARIYPPEILASIQATHLGLVTQTEIFGSAPSFFYTLALGLFIGFCASTKMSGRLHCLLWIAIALCLELLQHRLISYPLVSSLTELLSESTWELVGPYWTRGTFDQLDLLASVIGGSIAMALLTYTPGEQSD